MTSTTKVFGFRQAASRHYYDAELLIENGRQANSGQLYGFATECGIKCLLIWKGYPSDPVTGDIKKKEIMRLFDIATLDGEII